MFNEVREFMRKPEIGPTGSSPPVPAHDEQFRVLFPTLWEYVTHTVWDDGSPRETTTLFLFVSEGRWKLMLKDRARDLISFLVGDTMDEVFRSAEQALFEDKMDWRVDRPPPGRRGKG